MGQARGAGRGREGEGKEWQGEQWECEGGKREKGDSCLTSVCFLEPLRLSLHCRLSLYYRVPLTYLLCTRSSGKTIIIGSTVPTISVDLNS